MHDALNPYDLVHHELDQRRETGYEVEHLAERFAGTDPDDRDVLLGLLDELARAERHGPWPYQEPDDLDGIRDLLPAVAAGPRPGDIELADRILGGWLGRIAGCNLGKPVEMGEHWTVAHLRDYLERAGAYPLRDYIPALDPMPDGFVFQANWTETTQGRIAGSARDDDIDFAILALHLLERHMAPGCVRSTSARHGWNCSRSSRCTPPSGWPTETSSMA
jgi:hypothetical protein